MPIRKILASEWASLFQAAVQSRTADLEVAVGPFADGFVFPLSEVQELQREDLRTLSHIISLSSDVEFEEIDLDRLAYNDGVIRSDGARATGVARFSRAAVPTLDLTVPRGFPLGTLPDESTGNVTVFVTTEARTLPAASAASYFNAVTGRYELDVPVIAVTSGARGLIGANVLKRPLRSISSLFDGVTNVASTVGGSDRETNTRVLRRILLAVIGRQLSTADGRARWVLDNYPQVSDVLVVRGNDELLLRASTDSGAVDVYILGEALLSTTEAVQPFLAIGQLVPIANAPLVSVQTVTVGATTYIQGTDYEAVIDTGPLAGSTRAQDGIRFLPAVTPVPTVGAVVSMTYTYDSLIRAIQAAGDADDVASDGADVLEKRAVIDDLFLTARLRVLPGFASGTVLTAVQTALTNYSDDLLLGADVELSDIQGVVRLVSGVDNFLIDRLSLSAAATGTVDILIARNHKARSLIANRAISIIS